MRGETDVTTALGRGGDRRIPGAGWFANPAYMVNPGQPVTRSPKPNKNKQTKKNEVASTEHPKHPLASTITRVCPRTPLKCVHEKVHAHSKHSG